MRRRDFLSTFLGGAAALRPLAAAAAQPPSKMCTIGVLANEPWPPIDGLRDGLRALGYVEGTNFRIEDRWAQGRNDRFTALAVQLVALPVDVIVTWGTPAALAARQATATIPIVMGSIGDPIGAGLVSNIAHPAGNITGFTPLAPETVGKRLELLRELVPSLSKVTMLSNPTNPYSALEVEKLQPGVSALHIRTENFAAKDDDELDRSLDAIRGHRPDGILVINDQFLLSRRVRLVAFMAENQLPAVYGYKRGPRTFAAGRGCSREFALLRLARLMLASV